jgi:hypothetical protein
MKTNSGYQGAILINALNLQRSTVQSLWKIAQRQNRYLRSKNFNRLFASKSDKEALIESLRKWGKEIRYYYEHWDQIQEELSPEDRHYLLSLIESISELIENTIHTEMQNLSLIESRKKELIEELGTIDFFQECMISAIENRN